MNRELCSRLNQHKTSDSPSETSAKPRFLLGFMGRRWGGALDYEVYQASQDSQAYQVYEDYHPYQDCQVYQTYQALVVL